MSDTRDSRQNSKNVSQIPPEIQNRLDSLEASLSTLAVTTNDISQEVAGWHRRLDDLFHRTAWVSEQRLDDTLHRMLTVLEEIRNVKTLASDLLDQKKSIEELKNTMRLFFSYEILGISYKRVPLTRYLSVSIYIKKSDAKTPYIAERALTKFLKELGFSKDSDLSAVFESWWKEWIFRSRKAITHEETTSRLKSAERALSLATLHTQQAMVSKNLAEAAKALCDALGEEGAARIGNIYVARKKVRGIPRTVVMELTQQQLEKILTDGDKEFINGLANFCDDADFKVISHERASVMDPGDAQVLEDKSP